MNFIIVIIILAFLGMLIFWRNFRTWITRQLRAVSMIFARYLPIIGRAVLGGMGTYARVVVCSAVISLVLIISALIINAPGFTAFAFVVALTVVLLTWLPTGTILRIFKMGSAVIPKGLKIFVSWVAIFGLIGFLYPDMISFKYVFGLALLWFVLMGMTVKINVLDKIIFPLVVLMCLTFSWKYFFPDSFRSSTRYLVSWGKVSATWKDRGSIKNEAQAVVTYGHPIKDIRVAYLADISRGEILDLRDTNISISYGTVIKIFSHKEEIKEFQGQGFIEIQLPKKSGSFVKGEKYWVEADLIQLVTPNELAEKEKERQRFIADSIKREQLRTLAGSLNLSQEARRLSHAYTLYQPGVHVIDLPKGMESQVWDSIPYGCSYNFDRGKTAKFSVIYSDGTIANSWEPGKWLNKYKFKIKNLDDERPVLIVRQVLACR